MLYIKVPYDEKDIAKKLGAVWIPSKKSWAVMHRKDYYKFGYWVFKEFNEPLILIDAVYLVEGIRHCPKCGNLTTVIAMGTRKIMFLNNKAYYTNPDSPYEEDRKLIHPDAMDEYHWTEAKKYSNSDYVFISPLPESFVVKYKDVLKESYNFKFGYSKTMMSSYYANHCQSCNTIQGDFYLFDEPSSPFWIYDYHHAEKLTFKKIKLKDDLVTEPNGVPYDYELSNYHKYQDSNFTY